MFVQALVEEFEQRLQALHEKGLGEDEVAQKASEAVAAVRANGKKSPGMCHSQCFIYTLKTDKLYTR